MSEISVLCHLSDARGFTPYSIDTQPVLNKNKKIKQKSEAKRPSTEAIETY